MAMPMRPWGHDFCPPSMAISGRGWASGRLLFTWLVIITQCRKKISMLTNKAGLDLLKNTYAKTFFFLNPKAPRRISSARAFSPAR